jgi:inorganic pyrophosphatase
MSALPRPALKLALLLGLPLAALQPGLVPLPAQAVLASRFLVATCAMNPDATLNVVIDRVLEGRTALALGRIPRSILASGEPVPALVVGAARPGGTVRGRALGLLARVQDGRTEYRVVVVPPDGPCGQDTTLDQLQARVPDLRAGFRLAFGPAPGSAGIIQQGRKEAVRLVGDAVTAFECALVQEADKRPLGPDGNPLPYRWPGARNGAD